MHTVPRPLPAAFALSLLAACATPASAAADPEAPGTARLEIVDGARTLSMLIALSDDGRPAEVSLSDGRSSYDLHLRRNDDSGRAPLVRLDLRRVARSDGARDAASLSLKLVGRAPVGRRTVLTDLSPGAGDGRIAVAVTLQPAAS